MPYKNKEQDAAYHREYYHTHKEQQQKKQREYYEKNREKIYAKVAEWRKRHPGADKAMYAKSYQKHKQERLPAGRVYGIAYRQRLKQQVLAHYGTRCVCCGERNPRLLTLDHIQDDGAAHRRTVGTR